MCEIYDQIYNKGVAAERVKTEAEKKRADRLADKLKKERDENRRLRKLLAEKA